MLKKVRIALIPAYQPESCLEKIVCEVRKEGFQIVVVDDGSSEEKRAVFQKIERDATVLRHDQNQGKGRALKTGLSYIRTRFPADSVVVTVDADGQHKTEDVKKVCAAAERNAEALILGSRRMKGDVPLRSWFGNTLTRQVYQVLTGMKVYDTQTGLRAFESGMIPQLLNIAGERYEYEMNVLLECSRKRIPIKEIKIQTVYLDDNMTSHFDTLKDSVRIYREILKFSAASLGSFLVDYGMYVVLMLILSGWESRMALLISNVGARIVSAGVNYTLNRRVVFHSDASPLKSLMQYIALAAGILAGNTIVLEILVNRIGMNQYTGKLCTELLFFLLSWFVQSRFIFRKRKGE